MVRSEDPPGRDKHLRFGHFTELLSSVLVGFPGVKSIVLHTHGAKGEHPHLHVWWSGEKAVTNQTIRDRLKKYNALFLQMKSQNDWSFRNHDSYGAWATYVQRNKTHKVLHGDLPAPEPELPTVIMSPPQTPIIAAPVRRVKKLTAEERLINYCKVECGFVHNQWSLGNYELGEQRDKMITKARRAVVAYANGRLHNNQLIAMIRNVMYVFADEDLRDALGENWAASILNCL